MGKGQKEVLPSEYGSLGTLPYGKSGHGYCITFIKRLDDGVKWQLLGQKPSALPGLCI